MKIIKLSAAALALIVGAVGSAFTVKSHPKAASQEYYWFEHAAPHRFLQQATTATEAGSTLTVTANSNPSQDGYINDPTPGVDPGGTPNLILYVKP